MSEWSNYLVHRREVKYVGKVKTKGGRIRYFYSQQQLQADTKKLEADLNRQFDQQNTNQWTRA